jgi:hypothetical protein
MRATLLAATLATVTLGSTLIGCANTASSTDVDDAVFVDDGKEDDFFSVNAREYQLKGRTSVTLDASYAGKPEAERKAAALKLIGYKNIAIAWFITQYFVDKEEEQANHDYGGLGGMAKAGEYEDLEVSPTADGLTWNYSFKQLAAGSNMLPSRLPLRSENGKRVFDMEIGTPTNDEMAQLETNAEWYRQAPWGDWNPATAPADKKTTMTFEFAPDTASTDGYLDLERLTSDGVLDMDVYFGWDYHNDYHIKHSQSLFTWLQSEGFHAPVANWDALTPESGAFTKTIKADGRDVKVEIRMYFGKPGTETDPDTDAGGVKLEKLADDSLTKRDVVIYSGHSGPFYGFALANWNKTTEGDLDDTDMRAIQMPADKYQLILANGCDTYQIGTAFKENPAKNGKNVDVITSTSFSNAGTPQTVEDFINSVMPLDAQNQLEPHPVSNMLTALDSASYGFDTMYGMHGIDDDPKLVPFAHRDNFGKGCTANSDCGGPGNLCVGATGHKTCTAACTATSACGTGYTCKSVASASTSTIFGKACAKTQ